MTRNGINEIWEAFLEAAPALYLMAFLVSTGLLVWGVHAAERLDARLAGYGADAATEGADSVREEVAE